MKKIGFLSVVLGVLFLVAGTGKAYSQNYRCNYYISGQPSLALPDSFDEGELTPEEKMVLDLMLSMMEMYTDDGCYEDQYFGYPTYYFELDETELMGWLQNFYDTVWKQDNGFIVWKYDYDDEDEYAIHLDSLIYETRWYEDEDNPFFGEEGNKLWEVERAIFKEVDGYLILDKEVFIYYDTMEVDDIEDFDFSFLSGVVCEMRMTYTYPYYELLDEDDDNKTLVKSGDEELYLDCIGEEEDGIKEIQRADITIYPNPAKEQITIALPFNGNVDVKMFNMLGVNVLSQQHNQSEINIDIQSLPAGVYLVRCSNNNNVITKRFVKQ